MVEHASQRQLLTHSSRELFRERSAFLFQPEPRDKTVSRGGAILNPVQHPAEFEMFFDGEVLEEFGLVGDETEARFRHLGLFTEVDAAHSHLTGIRPCDAGEHVQRRGFASPVPAEEADDLSGLDAEGEIIHGLYRAEAFGEMTCFNHARLTGVKWLFAERAPKGTARQTIAGS